MAQHGSMLYTGDVGYSRPMPTRQCIWLRVFVCGRVCMSGDGGDSSGGGGGGGGGSPLAIESILNHTTAAWFVFK